MRYNVLRKDYSNFKLIAKSEKFSDFVLRSPDRKIGFFDSVDKVFNGPWCQKFGIEYKEKDLYQAINNEFEQRFDKILFEKEICSFFSSDKIIENLYDSIQNKNILLIGAGPDIKDIKFENIEYDEIFTVNNFFLNHKILSLNPKFILLNNEIKGNNKFRVFLNKENPYIFKFYHDDQQSFKKHLNDKDKYVYYNPRFNGCSIMNRALCVISFFNPNKIYFCGFDLEDTGHAFEGQKRLKPITQQELDMTFFMFKILNRMNIHLIKVNSVYSSYDNSLINRVFHQSI